jgi:hypothetical protein
MTKWIRLFAGLGILVLVLAACGSSGGSKTGGGGSSTSSTTKAKAKPTATATPTTNLTNGATVTVSVKGFTAGKTLGINECAQAGQAEVGQDDCALDAIKTLTVGADGTGTGTTTVTSGPVGKNAHMCGTPDVRCFLSVGELVAGEAERADDVDITFAS